MKTGRHAPRHTVLVTDAEQRSALAAVRALGGAGHRVYAASSKARPLASASRYVERSIRVADPLHEAAAFVDDLASAIERLGADVVLPMTDASMLAVLATPERLAPAALPFASYDSFGAISDKQRLLATAPRFGIQVPAQFTICPEDIWAIADVRVPFPVVVKPARSVGEFDGRRARYNVQYARDAAELASVVEHADRAAFPLMLQQRVVGPGIGIFLLLWDGDIVAAFSHRRIREKPPSGGVSVYRESIPADPDLLARSRALLEHFGWRGVAMIEYKVDAATGTPYLMEINGRFWGSLQLAIDAGVDFPNLLLATAVDHDRPEPPAYRSGVRSRWWWGDVDQLLTRLRRSPEALALPPDAPTRWQAVREFCRIGGRHDHNEVLRLTDPMPFVRESINWLRRE